MARLSGVRNERSAREGWAAWFKMAEESGIPALVKFSRLKEKRLDGLVVHALHPISTGKLEGSSTTGSRPQRESAMATGIKTISSP